MSVQQREGLSPEDYEQRRAMLLNKHQLQLGDLDKRQAEEQKAIERGALADWELRFAHAKVDQKDKHYKVS